jgi:hypothetical protein
MHIARNVVYALVASLLLFTVSVAVQRTFSRQAPKAGEGLVGPTSPSASRLGARVAASYSGADDGSLIDEEALDSDRPATKRATSRNANGTPDRTLAGRFLTPAGDQAASGRSERTWLGSLSALGSLFSSGSGVSGGTTPGTVAPSAESVSPARPQSNSGPVREVFFAERDETACQPGQREFMMDDLRALHVCIVWSGLSGTYASELTFLSPDGHVYQTMTLAFATPDAPATATTLDVGGQPYAVQRAGWGRAGETMVVATLPVSGTYITQHNLAGGWTVKIALNGESVDQDEFTLRATQ